jgi:capsule biosynthesis phosphatase
MIEEEKIIVFDLDKTLCQEKKSHIAYSDLLPRYEVVEKLREYKRNGFHIIISTSRNMRKYGGNIGKINCHTLKNIFLWLEKHDIPHDEIHVGKPWTGRNGFYVDDKAIRPDEFIKLTYDEILELAGD